MNNLPCTVWLTGLSAAGKTTLADALAAAFAEQHVNCDVLDGDAVRQTLCRDLGFSPQDRSENVRRVAVRCRELNDTGIVAIAALVSPYRADRDIARQTVGEQRFVEVYLSTPLAVCEARDPKGLYRRARAGELANLTGIGDVYEAPLAPELTFDTSVVPTNASVAAIMRLLGSPMPAAD
ncbi:adenylyl-sulfate kinase [Paraburkholderia phosphatilytica]|uniref:adenylyl-sulfate kinase n=1 Tax=Paraburkholderia phosphatilytica TaxID=2282883 RepID=UPI000E488FDE|nr:adenylyl-sulfate kinase [Paraburkholderia phosphatilytica]